MPGEQPGIVWASWTIGVEMLFYAVFPVLFFTLKSASSKVATLLLAMLAAHLLPSVLPYLLPQGASAAEFDKYSIVRHLPVFLIGMVAFDAYGWLRDRKRFDLGLSLICGGAFGLVLPMTGGGNFPIFSPYYWQAAFYALMFLGLSLRPLRFIVNKFTRFLGKISYSIYLVHPPIVFSLSSVYGEIPSFGVPQTVGFLLSAVVTFAVVVPVAWATFTLIEKPMEIYGKRLIARLSALQAAE